MTRLRAVAIAYLTLGSERSEVDADTRRAWRPILAASELMAYAPRPIRWRSDSLKIPGKTTSRMSFACCSGGFVRPLK